MRRWYRRWQTLLGEVWRFGLVGATNVGINFLLFNLLVMTRFGDSELKANVVATAVATTTSYLMNRGWTFRHRKTSRVSREYVLFFLLNGIGLGIELAALALVKYGLGLTALWAINLAKLGGLGLGTVFRFWSYRTFVFASPRPAGVASGSTAADPAPADQSSVAQAPANQAPAEQAPASPTPTEQDPAGPAPVVQDPAGPTSPAIPARP